MFSKMLQPLLRDVRVVLHHRNHLLQQKQELRLSSSIDSILLPTSQFYRHYSCAAPIVMQHMIILASFYSNIDWQKGNKNLSLACTKIRILSNGQGINNRPAIIRSYQSHLITGLKPLKSRLKVGLAPTRSHRKNTKRLLKNLPRTVEEQLEN